jgi:hypothetical protein
MDRATAPGLDDLSQQPHGNPAAIGFGGAAGLGPQNVRQGQVAVQNLVEVGSVHGDQSSRPSALEGGEAIRR